MTRDHENELTRRTGGERRRTFLKVVGSSAMAIGGIGLSSVAATAQNRPDGPPNPDSWSLVFEDQFEGNSLDTSKWDIGWGWGNTTTDSPTRIVEENVAVEDGQLGLTGTHNGDNVLSGAVNTRESLRFRPGTYLEARLKFASRQGFHPAFWAKPIEYSSWPPGISVAELHHNRTGRDDDHVSGHYLHYVGSMEAGDKSAHEILGASYESDTSLTENFHTFGAEWQPDGISIYVDGQEVDTWTNGKMLASMERGAPFYINLSQRINIGTSLGKYFGQADLTESWGETTYADWVRVWEQ